MSVKILIPTPLRPFVEQRDTVELEGGTIAVLLDGLIERYPDIGKHLLDDNGQLRSFVNVYVNDEDIRSLQRSHTRVSDDDVVSIVPSVAVGNNDSGVADATELSPDEILRYSRHLIMPEVALAGQKRLKRSRVLMIGTGGLGAPVGLYLTAAGVGTIGMVDFDVVDTSNLQRQVTFGTSDVGRSKLEAAHKRLADLNPNVAFELHDTRLSRENALDIVGRYDLVVDGTDNFPTRYLVNDACVLLKKPYVYGSIFRFEGQASVFAAAGGPCYRCLYPEPPPPGLVPSCAEGGVLGVLPGIVGSIQALEAIKLLLGKEGALVGRLLVFDALKMNFRELKVQRSNDCPICGEQPTITELIDYDAFCGIGKVESSGVSVPEITPVELKQRLDARDDLVLVDVREPHEFDICNLGGRLIPLRDMPARVHELDSADEFVVYCRSGVRSATAVDFLHRAGFGRVKNLRGGILAWSDEVDPSVPKY